MTDDASAAARPGPPAAARIGTVAGRDVPVGLLEARLAAMRQGPFAQRLPGEGTPEGRRLRRFVAQLLLTEELVRAEAARLGVTATDTGMSTSDVPVGDLRPLAVEPTGGVVSAVLAGMPLARALHRHVTAAVRPPEARLLAYYRADPDRWRRPERRTLQHLLVRDRPCADTPLLDTQGMRWTCVRDELPPALAEPVFSATRGDIVGPVRTPFGWHLCRVEDVEPENVVDFATVRRDILARLTQTERDRYFDLWLEQRRRDIVATEPGHEHPGDPRHPDYAHHH